MKEDACYRDAEMLLREGLMDSAKAQMTVKLLKRHRRIVNRDRYRYILFWWALLAVALCGLAAGAWKGWLDF